MKKENVPVGNAIDSLGKFRTKCLLRFWINEGCTRERTSVCKWDFLARAWA